MKYALVKPSFYKSLFIELYGYIKAPSPSYVTNKSVGHKLSDTAALFVIKITLFVAIAVVMALLSPVFEPENIALDNLTERLSPLMLLFVAGFALPLLEELGFRLSLRLKPIYLAMSVSVIAYYILTKVVFGTSNTMVEESFAIRIGSSIAIGAALFPILRRQTIANALGYFWQSNFRWIFYFSCASFAAVHLLNYEMTVINILLMPLITMPQIVSGVIYGFARVTLGFQFALLAHVLNNVVFVAASMLPGGDLLP